MEKLSIAERLRLPVHWRPIDLIVLALLTALCVLQVIQGAEISELQKEVRIIQMEGR
jgi:hypothetical protein